jgi:hypothetical protein
MSNGTELLYICHSLEAGVKLDASDIDFLRELIPTLDFYEDLDDFETTPEQIKTAIEKADLYEELKNTIDVFLFKLKDLDPKLTEKFVTSLK